MKTRNHKPIGNIGGGLAGHASAYTLAAGAYEVISFEANPWHGGQAAEWKGRSYGTANPTQPAEVA